MLRNRYFFVLPFYKFDSQPKLKLVKAMKVLLLTVLALLLSLNLAKCQSYDSGHRHNTDDPFSYFGSKTTYDAVSAKQDFTQPNCNPAQLWLLSRHGTRNPANAIIDKIAKLNEYKYKITENSSLSKDEIEAIHTWQLNLTQTDSNELNSQGVEDMSSLGLRLQQSYAEIFNEPYNSGNFEVLSSPKSRCVNSAYNFLKSAFNINITNIPIISGDDIKLNMSKFRSSRDEDDTIGGSNMDERYGYLEELRKFQHGEEMQRVLLGVSKTMGLNYTLSLDTVLVMYESCRYEKSWHVRSHPAWCAVFSQDDLDVLEYREDLHYYYSTGYGDSFNERLGCPVIKDLVAKFRYKSRTRLGPKGVFYFAHSSNILGAIVRLGFARDLWNLTSDNYDKLRGRQWRTSYLSPFASNLMVVLYECLDGYKVTFYVNGNPAVVEQYGCTLCPWQVISNMLDPIVSSPSCTFQETSRAVSAVIPKVIAVIVAPVIVLVRSLFL
ncbi:Histidine phosphatase superfamily,Histidine phosphatase superfamily, clade-2,Histidine acid [Cinara cedri]|uniref:Multiple inositol polyphosphate phosphatase 1 n=1 Tax=Cinara cedri TaxID=506608 RepID=A0A5E4M1B9_9HEMI|nr:Histidine phosphatase superfamily,Histidine phosphatase superfamily, clade-2,Histidine acid [Cinara cedri]